MLENILGPLVFGLVIGWVTYRTLRRSNVSGLGDIATVIGAVGGAAVVALFPKDTGMFASYCIGLGIGFFGYLATAIVFAREAGEAGESKKILEWLGSGPGAGEPTPPADRPVRRPPV